MALGLPGGFCQLTRKFLQRLTKCFYVDCLDSNVLSSLAAQCGLCVRIVRQAEAWTTPDTLNQNLHSDEIPRYSVCTLN